MVEGMEDKGEKEGKRSLEYRPGYQLATKGVVKTLGWKVLTGEVNAVYKSRPVTVDEKQLSIILEAGHPRAIATPNQLNRELKLVIDHQSRTQPS